MASESLPHASSTAGSPQRFTAGAAGKAAVSTATAADLQAFKFPREPCGVVDVRVQRQLPVPKSVAGAPPHRHPNSVVGAQGFHARTTVCRWRLTYSRRPYYVCWALVIIPFRERRSEATSCGSNRSARTRV
eukprot:9502010-Pyramimonas_sp.AAC.1